MLDLELVQGYSRALSAEKWVFWCRIILILAILNWTFKMDQDQPHIQAKQNWSQVTRSSVLNPARAGISSPPQLCLLTSQLRYPARDNTVFKTTLYLSFIQQTFFKDLGAYRAPVKESMGSFMFKSNSSRLTKSKPLNQPGPGAYSPKEFERFSYRHPASDHFIAAWNRFFLFLYLNKYGIFLQIWKKYHFADMPEPLFTPCLKENAVSV